MKIILEKCDSKDDYRYVLELVEAARAGSNDAESTVMLMASVLFGKLAPDVHNRGRDELIAAIKKVFADWELELRQTSCSRQLQRASEMLADARG
jgi:hypothetical protein